mgnify:CR=1 FL=1
MELSAPQQQHNVSLSGGSEKMDYYINFGYTDQEGFFKSKALNYDRYNLRMNLNAEVAKNLKASVKMNGIIDNICLHGRFIKLFGAPVLMKNFMLMTLRGITKRCQLTS